MLTSASFVWFLQGEKMSENLLCVCFQNYIYIFLSIGLVTRLGFHSPLIQTLNIRFTQQYAAVAA